MSAVRYTINELARAREILNSRETRDPARFVENAPPSWAAHKKCHAEREAWAELVILAIGADWEIVQLQKSRWFQLNAGARETVQARIEGGQAL